MSKKILVVEDDQRITMSLNIRLKNEGYETVSAEDSTLGIQAAVKESPDLIILDIMMPAGGGIWVAENLRSLPETKETPIIFITASRKAGLKEEAMALPNVAFVEKPYDAGDLLGQVKTMLEGTPAAPAS